MDLSLNALRASKCPIFVNRHAHISVKLYKDNKKLS